MATGFPSFPKFDVSDQSSIGQRWKKWVVRFENFVCAMGITRNDRKRAMLLHYAGEEVYNIFDTLQDTGTANDYIAAKQKLEDHCNPQKNVEFEIYKFRQARQNTGENMDTYYTRLKHLAEYCEFDDCDREIKSQIIQGCESTRLRRRALRDPEMTLKTLLDTARAMEIAQIQATGMEAATESVNAAKTNPPRGRTKQKQFHTPKHSKDTKCYYCGGNWPHRDRACPAKGVECRKCHKVGHFAKVCKSTLTKQTPTKSHVSYSDKPKINNIQNETYASSSDDEYVFTMGKGNSHDCNLPKVNVKIDNADVKMMIDSGASINILDEHAFELISRQRKVNIEKSKTNVYTYGSSSSLPIVGRFRGEIETKRKITFADFYVVKGKHGSLMCYQTAQELDLIKIQVNAVTQSSQIVDEFADRFVGIGKLKDFEVNLHIDKTVQPVAQPHRRIPFHIRKKVEEELQYLEDNDIIEKVEGPTPWISPIVAAPKPKQPDKVRICVDMRQANKCISRTRHVMPTVDDMINDHNGSKIYSKLDLNAGYHQLVLSPESRYITTFSTHVGLRRYKRLNFGISSASEVFQNTIQQLLEDIPGAKNLSDDIIIYGKTQDDHDRALRAVMTRLREKNITLNRQKCEFNKRSLEFYGYVFSEEGISADPKKIKAIKEAENPKNASEVRSFLGMANYCARFIKDFATIAKPLRELTKKCIKWEWNQEHTNAITEIKRNLTSETVMSYFDPRKNTEVIVDASPFGLGAMLVQGNENEQKRVVAYASKTLSPVEQRYSQTEREALAIVWSCEHFHLYLYGQEFSIISDHKPLELIFNNPSSRPPARIERWGLRLQPYNFKVIYKAGKDNPADYMSRHPVINFRNSRASKIAEEYVNFVVENDVPKALSLVEIQEATQKDTLMKDIQDAINSGKWYEFAKIKSPDRNAIFKLRNELTLSESGIILRDSRILVPKSLQRRVIKLAHEGHQGIVKTKSLLREKVWFPGIDSLVESEIRSCIPCQATVDCKQAEPLKMSELPEGPWTELSMDFCGPFPSGDYLMVMIDEYSWYPDVEILKSTSSKTVIPKIDKIFSSFGIPKVLKTDNGPPFNGTEFKNFAEYLGFRHRKITPLWPKANAESERFMRTIEKTARAAQVENKCWKQEIFKFLRNYRATPHCTTGKSPYEMLFARQMKIKIPTISENTQDDFLMRKRDQLEKLKMKNYADDKHYVKPSKLQTGDLVLVKQQKTNKLSPPYDPKPLVVTEKKGTMITAENEDKSRCVTRNSLFFKQIENKNVTENDNEENRAGDYKQSRYALRRNVKPPQRLIEET